MYKRQNPTQTPEQLAAAILAGVRPQFHRALLRVAANWFAPSVHEALISNLPISSLLTLTDEQAHHLEQNGVRTVGDVLRRSLSEMPGLLEPDEVESVMRFAMDPTGPDLECSVEELGLPDHISAKLRRGRINTIGDLLERNPDDLLRLPGIATGNLNEIVAKLAGLGLELPAAPPRERGRPHAAPLS